MVPPDQKWKVKTDHSQLLNLHPHIYVQKGLIYSAFTYTYTGAACTHVYIHSSDWMYENGAKYHM